MAHNRATQASASEVPQGVERLRLPEGSCLELSARRTLVGQGLRLADGALEPHIPELAPGADSGTLTLAGVNNWLLRRLFG